MTLVERAEDLVPALAAAFAIDDRVLVEDVVRGREVDVAVLGRPDGTRVVSPALEIVVDGVFGYEEKYGGSARFVVPAPLAETDRKALEDAAVAVFDALGCAGVARVDFFLPEEAAARSSTRSTRCLVSPRRSQVPKMFAAAGLVLPRTCSDLLVQDCLT